MSGVAEPAGPVAFVGFVAPIELLEPGGLVGVVEPVGLAEFIALVALSPGVESVSLFEAN